MLGGRLLHQFIVDALNIIGLVGYTLTKRNFVLISTMVYKMPFMKVITTLHQLVIDSYCLVLSLEDLDMWSNNINMQLQFVDGRDHQTYLLQLLVIQLE